MNLVDLFAVVQRGEKKYSSQPARNGSVAWRGKCWVRTQETVVNGVGLSILITALCENGARTGWLLRLLPPTQFFTKFLHENQLVSAQGLCTCCSFCPSCLLRISHGQQFLYLVHFNCQLLKLPPPTTI